MLMDGKKYRDELLEEYKQIIENEHLQIRLDIIQVGDNKESDVYVRNKLKYANLVGIEAVLHKLDNSSTLEVANLIEDLNKDEQVTGIILQSPTPTSVDFDYCASLIDFKKDIDGFTEANINRLYHKKDCLMPCTVKGIIKLLKHYEIDLDGKNVVIIGRGDIVGKPLMLALTNENATVTLCHSHTKDLSFHTKQADIIISATGKKGLVTGDMVRKGFIGVDVGITVENEKMYGDFDFESISKKASLITPTPGGVGPMTVAMIIDNLIEAKKGIR